MPTRLTQTGAEVQDDLYKIEDIDLATEEKAGLMSPEDKTKLDNIDAEIPTKLSDLEDDSTHRTVTDTEKQTWNNKSDFSGRYQDLTGRPYIPQRTSDLRNDSGFITRLVDDLANYYLKSEVYTKAEVAALISSIQGFSVKVVDVLPTASAETMRAIYLVPSAEPQTGNTKDEWITVEDNGAYRWEQIGSMAISLDGYVTDEELTAALQGYVTSAAFATALAGKQDVIGDLSEIRAGAQAGASAYQKPAAGISATDLSEAVQESLEKADGALQVETDPTVPAWAKAANPPTEVFWATYGETTAAEIDAAVSAGKVVLCKDDFAANNSHIFTLCQYNSGAASLNFSCAEYSVIYYLVLYRSPETWRKSRVFLQNTADMVQTLSGNESATNKYPSTKAVADYVASKAEVYECTYGTTTYSAVADAITAGKIPVVKYNSQLYIYTKTEASQIIFVSVSSFYIYRVMVKTDDTWYTNSYVCEIQSNRRSSWQSTPDNSHYPSEKLVYDSIEGMITSEEQSSIPDPTNAYYTKSQSDERYCKWGVVSQKQTWTQAADGGYNYTMSNIVYGWIPQSFIDIVSAFGVVFNEETGYFEIDTLTDISYQEMLAIYAATGGTAKLGIQRVELPYYKDVRAPLPIRDTATTHSLSFQFTNGNFERIIVQGNQAVSTVGSAFNSCPKLRKVSGCFISQTSGAPGINGAYSLEELYFRGLKINFSVPNSPRLSLASVVYMVTNAVNTSAITFTLHATAYARCQADTTEYTYNGQTYTGILAYASAKNITIASA